MSITLPAMEVRLFRGHALYRELTKAVTARKAVGELLGVGALGPLEFELSVLRLEGVGDVLEEDQAEDDVLVLSRVHVVTQGVGHLPQFGFVADGGGGGVI